MVIRVLPFWELVQYQRSKRRAGIRRKAAISTVPRHVGVPRCVIIDLHRHIWELNYGRQPRPRLRQISRISARLATCFHVVVNGDDRSRCTGASAATLTALALQSGGERLVDERCCDPIGVKNRVSLGVKGDVELKFINHNVHAAGPRRVGRERRAYSEGNQGPEDCQHFYWTAGRFCVSELSEFLGVLFSSCLTRLGTNRQGTKQQTSSWSLRPPPPLASLNLLAHAGVSGEWDQR